MHIYPWQIDSPGQLSIDALNTTTPNLADLSIYLSISLSLSIYIYIYIEQCTYSYGRLTPLTIKHRYLEYHYTKLSRSIYIEQCTYTHGRLTPPSIEHRCLEYHYTKLGTSIYIYI